MKDIFNKIGISVSSEKENTDSKAFKIFVINNVDGSPRWIWPRPISKPLFLKFYNAKGWRSQSYAFLIRLVFFFKLQHLFFKSKTIYAAKNSSASIFELSDNWALFTGTPGPNNKAILFHVKNNIGTFYKIALTPAATALLENEQKYLSKLSRHTFETFTIPEIKSTGSNILAISDISEKTTRKTQFTQSHLNTLIELNAVSATQIRLADYDLWQNLEKDLNALTACEDARLPKGMLRLLNKLYKSTQTTDQIELCLSHGDFTPWNMCVKNYKLHIYDWELCDSLRPLGYDAFHYIIQQGILVEHKSWKEIRFDIHQQLSPQNFGFISTYHLHAMEKYLKLYLLLNTVYYLKVYTQQKNWHTQVNWLLTTWNAALTEFASERHQHRELLIMNLFDFLSDKKYSTLKFPNMAPEKLSEYSDIDLCVEKGLPKEVSQFLKTHPLVSKVHTVTRSFMVTKQIFCYDGSILSLDLIWKLKRKNLEMIKIDSFLNNTYSNEFGVKMPELIDNSRYVGLFYLLNNSHIPDKYKAYGDVLNRSNKVLDILMSSYFVDDSGSKKSVINYVKIQPYNKGLSQVLNNLNYCLDFLRSLLFNRGMVITFSGVDGAGKSTIIEKTKYKLEKQLRKRVIVIRHRPSLLPILSAISKGKTAAEKASMEKLPRTGTNKNLFSSLLRFAYYFTDYAFGQFVIHIRYVMRGYIVLYDRYYYDFINDAKRSNIELPDCVTHAGFRFLLKPRLNFFLYAKPEVILKRKKELDAETIEHLTDKYQQLFLRLGKQYSNSVYQSIENVEIEKTLHSIFKTIIQKAN